MLFERDDTIELTGEQVKVIDSLNQSLNRVLVSTSSSNVGVTFMLKEIDNYFCLYRKKNYEFFKEMAVSREEVEISNTSLKKMFGGKREALKRGIASVIQGISKELPFLVNTFTFTCLDDGVSRSGRALRVKGIDNAYDIVLYNSKGLEDKRVSYYFKAPNEADIAKRVLENEDAKKQPDYFSQIKEYTEVVGLGKKAGEKSLTIGFDDSELIFNIISPFIQYLRVVYGTDIVNQCFLYIKESPTKYTFINETTGFKVSLPTEIGSKVEILAGKDDKLASNLMVLAQLAELKKLFGDYRMVDIKAIRFKGLFNVMHIKALSDYNEDNFRLDCTYEVDFNMPDRELLVEGDLYRDTMSFAKELYKIDREFKEEIDKGNKVTIFLRTYFRGMHSTWEGSCIWEESKKVTKLYNQYMSDAGYETDISTYKVAAIKLDRSFMYDSRAIHPVSKFYYSRQFNDEYVLDYTIGNELLNNLDKMLTDGCENKMIDNKNKAQELGEAVKWLSYPFNTPDSCILCLRSNPQGTWEVVSLSDDTSMVMEEGIIPEYDKYVHTVVTLLKEIAPDFKEFFLYKGRGARDFLVSKDGKYVTVSYYNIGYISL